MTIKDRLEQAVAESQQAQEMAAAARQRLSQVLLDAQIEGMDIATIAELAGLSPGDTEYRIRMHRRRRDKDAGILFGDLALAHGAFVWTESWTPRLYDIGLSTRAVNSLRNELVRRPYLLWEEHRKRLLSIPNFGKHSTEEVLCWAAAYLAALEARPDIPEWAYAGDPWRLPHKPGTGGFSGDIPE